MRLLCLQFSLTMEANVVSSIIFEEYWKGILEPMHIKKKSRNAYQENDARSDYQS